jgi:hypothetical protein
MTGLRSLSTEGWMALPSVVTFEKVTPHGVVLHVPSEGNQCWNSVLPCTPQVRTEIDSTQWPSDSSGLGLIQSRPVYRLKY